MSRPWYARYPADYARDTTHLGLAEHGAYNLLLDRYYTHGALPSDERQLQRICHVTCPEEWQAVERVLTEFFVKTPDGWSNGRAERELIKAAEISERRAIAGSNGRAKQLANAGQSAKQTPGESQPQLQAKRAKASRWPANCEIGDLWKEGGANARKQHGLPPIDINLAATLFQNYWSTKSGQDATKLDWHKTWLTWVLRTKAEQKINGGRHDNGTTKAPTQFERLQARIAAARAREGEVSEHGRP